MAAKKKKTSKKKKKSKKEKKRKKVVVEEKKEEEKPEEKEEEKETSNEEEENEDEDLSEETKKTLGERPLEEEVPLEKKNRKLWVVGLITLLFVFGLTGWILFLTTRYSQEVVREVETETQTEAPVETATPAPVQLEREEISLEILNGSGVAGAAATTAETFEQLGYQIEEIGNAESTDGNELYVSSEVEEQIDVLLEDVEEELGISSISGELEDSSASARIILGR